VHAGTGSDYAVVAFYANKQITTGEGGAVFGSTPEQRDRIVSMRNQGRRPGDPWLRHDEVGFNYRLDELSAAMGVAQMRRVEDILARRRQVSAWYEEELGGVDEVELPRASEGAEPAWFVEFLRVGTHELRDHLVRWLGEHGVEAKAYFDPPIHRQPPYAGTGPWDLRHTDDAANRTLIVPYFAAMTREQVATVAGVVTDGLVKQ
jgi:dTDP-4-amino-4,6-dideoxygalactose transaminase